MVPRPRARRRLPRAGYWSSGPQSTPLPPSPPPVCPPCSPPGEDCEELTDAERATARMLLADPAVLEAAIGRVFDERLQQGDGEAIDLPVVEQLISDASAVDDVFAAVFPPPVTAADCLARGWPTAAFDRCCCASVRRAARARGAATAAAPALPPPPALSPTRVASRGCVPTSGGQCRPNPVPSTTRRGVPEPHGARAARRPKLGATRRRFFPAASAGARSQGGSEGCRPKSRGRQNRLASCQKVATDPVSACTSVFKAAKEAFYLFRRGALYLFLYSLQNKRSSLLHLFSR